MNEMDFAYTRLVVLRRPDWFFYGCASSAAGRQSAPTVSVTDGVVTIVVWQNADPFIRGAHDQQYLDAPDLLVRVDVRDTANISWSAPT